MKFSRVVACPVQTPIIGYFSTGDKKTGEFPFTESATGIAEIPLRSSFPPANGGWREIVPSDRVMAGRGRGGFFAEIPVIKFIAESSDDPKEDRFVRLMDVE
jgi:hypothetical protein